MSKSRKRYHDEDDFEADDMRSRRERRKEKDRRRENFEEANSGISHILDWSSPHNYNRRFR